MRHGRDRVVDTGPAASATDAAHARQGADHLYVVRADLLAGTVSVLWPAQARPPGRGRRSGRGREGQSSP